MGEPSMRTEVERIRRWYSDRAVDPVIRARYAPFNEQQVDSLCQQYRAVAESMRSIGRLSLADHRILDVGCGKGRFLRNCLDWGALPEHLHGVDVHADAIEEGLLRSPQIDLRVTDGIDLDFPDGSFDLVTEFVVFSSIDDGGLRGRLAEEMRRVLKADGYVFCWDLPTTRTPRREVLDLQELFPGMAAKAARVAIRPRPSEGLRPRFRPVLRWIDRFAYPPTHNAVLLGPKRKSTRRYHRVVVRSARQASLRDHTKTKGERPYGRSPLFSFSPGRSSHGEVNDDPGQRLGFRDDVDLSRRALVVAGPAGNGEHEPLGLPGFDDEPLDRDLALGKPRRHQALRVARRPLDARDRADSPVVTHSLPALPEHVVEDELIAEAVSLLTDVDGRLLRRLGAKAELHLVPSGRSDRQRRSGGHRTEGED
jgi:SAM-dependent methyltransferase